MTNLEFSLHSFALLFVYEDTDTLAPVHCLGNTMVVFFLCTMFMIESMFQIKVESCTLLMSSWEWTKTLGYRNLFKQTLYKFTDCK